MHLALLVVSASWLSCVTPVAKAAVRPEQVRIAEAKKTLSYIKEGMVVGGDRAITEVRVKEIRRAQNPGGFERMVIDLEGTRGGETVAIPRPPYYQVQVSEAEGRIVFSIWGKPKLDFDAEKVIAAFKKSTNIASVDLLPKLQDDVWTFSMQLKPNRTVEVFELSQPVRMILDIKAGG
jgi:hypothetical protein